MKTYRLLYVLIAGFMLLFGNQAFGQSAREDMVHAYILLKTANHNYGGHREAAIKEIERAGHDLGLDLRGRSTQREQQLQSDAQMAEAFRILHEVRNRLDRHDRDIAATHVDNAMHEIDLALRLRDR
jgi:hypothetical protein